MKLYICIGVIVTKKISLYDGKHAKLHFSPTSGKHLKKQFNLSVWRFFRKISQNREIDDKTADDLNILICHLPKKKDGSAYEPTALASLACYLHSPKKRKKMLYTSLGQSLLEQTVKPCPWSSVLKTTGTVSSNMDLPVCE